ncbi:hypothetical protein U9M48_039036 [Paspalum notatum var. saurae]|uniref:Uncharacterized protein n=1 Tax=Paspalum notatum var. saurae TaxID=547442 RepID=A0AAQ3XBN7_PASNO
MQTAVVSERLGGGHGVGGRGKRPWPGSVTRRQARPAFPRWWARRAPDLHGGFFPRPARRLLPAADAAAPFLVRLGSSSTGGGRGWSPGGGRSLRHPVRAAWLPAAQIRSSLLLPSPLAFLSPRALASSCSQDAGYLA